MLAGQVWTLTQTEEQLHCTVYRGNKGWLGRPTPEELETVCKYFQLDVSLAQLYKDWGAVDSHFQEVARKFQGEDTAEWRSGYLYIGYLAVTL